MTELAPAQTYDLNVLASSIGRFAIPNLNTATAKQSVEMVGAAVDELLYNDVPHVPNTMSELIGEAIKFDNKLINQLRNDQVSERMPKSLLKATGFVISQHRNLCLDTLKSDSPSEQLVDPQKIADAYGLPNMWHDANETLTSEIAKYGYMSAHPDVPDFLLKKVSESQTRQLIEYVSSEIIGCDSKLDLDVYNTDNNDMYHVFWSPTNNGLDYATPSGYDLATQLSFDIPHNVAHLNHLNALSAGQGAKRYNDSMGQRGFFEAVAVLSEHIILQICIQQPERLREAVAILGLPEGEDSLMVLSDWIAQDRTYEFKLRAARLYADRLVIEGLPYSEIVQEISLKMGISGEDARAETKKYLPWIGLGALYTLGYNTLLKAGVTSIPQAISSDKGVISTWAQFNAERKEL